MMMSCHYFQPSGSRPPSRQTSAPVVGRVATPVHSRTNSAGSNFSKQAGNPVITRELGVTSSKLVSIQLTRGVGFSQLGYSMSNMSFINKHCSVASRSLTFMV